MAKLTAEMIVDGLAPSDPQIAPDGRYVAFVAAPVGRREERRRSAIWLARVDGSSEPRPISAGLANDRAPRWSPDGEWLYFLSDRATPGQAQLQRLRVGGGEATALTTWRPRIDDFAPLPDGRRVALLATDPPDADQERRERERDDARVFGERWPLARIRLLDLATRQICTIDGGALRGRHVATLAAAPDGRTLAAVTWPTPEIDNLTRPAQIAIVDLDAGDSYMLCTTPCAVNTLVWSHDSRRIYYLSHAAAGCTSGSSLYCVELGDGMPRLIGVEESACPFELCRGRAGELLVTSAAGLDTRIERIEVAGDRRTLLATHRGDLSKLTASADGGIVAALYSGAASPLDVWAGPPDGPLARVSDLRPELREVCWGAQERLAWSAPDGLSLDGLLILPPGKTRADGPFALITLVHGGPYARFADGFHLSWYPSGQWLATHGYAVLLPNPRGGSGHGAEFSGVITGAVGIGDYADIMAGIDLLIAEGVADPQRLGIGGWSQGGFMAAWAVGQTGRFRAGLMGAGVSDWGMMVATSDIPEWEGLLGGFSGWEGVGPHRHTALSPISYVHRVRTPVLILHGEQDQRVPVSQACFFARGLRAYGIDHEFVVYPRQPHSLEERNHQIDALRRTRAWFDRWLRQEQQ